MKHLTEEQLSRRADGALEGRALAEADAHLAACAACRDALAALAANDAALRSALTHDPGPEYFQSFAARVEDRIRAAGLSGAQARERAIGGWGSPRRLAWIGGVAAVVVGAALALIQSQNFRTPDMRSRDLSSRIEESVPAPSAPARGVGAKEGEEADAVRAKTREAGARSNEQELRKQSAAGVDEKNEGAGKLAREAEPSRARQVKRDERGEDVPVGDTRSFAQPPATVPAPAATAPPGDAAKRVGHAGSVQPMREEPKAAAEEQQGAVRGGAPVSQPMMAFDRATGTPLCGNVVDVSGRPVAGARVVLAKLGRSAATDSAGHFCLDAPAGDHEVAVMAVGFREARQQVRVGGESAEVRLVVNAVDVLAAAGLASKSAADPFAALADTTRARVAEAQRLSSLAAGQGARDDKDQGFTEATAHDAAAEAWARALRGIPAGPARLEAGHALAEERYRAWQRSASAARRDAAGEAIAAWLAIAPPGARREEAAGWLERLGR